MSDVSDRAALLRSQALNAVYGALSGATVRVHGAEPYEYSGAVMQEPGTVVSRSLWTEQENETQETVTWQYETVCTISVRRKAVNRKPW